MVVCICVGCALFIAGAAFAGYRMRSLSKTAREAGLSTRTQVQQVVGRAQRLAPRIRELEAKQKAVAESITRLTTTARRFIR